MLQNMEYPALPPIKMLNFDSISELKIFLKFQQKAKIYLKVIWLHAIYLFQVKIHMKYE